MGVNLIQPDMGSEMISEGFQKNRVPNLIV